MIALPDKAHCPAILIRLLFCEGEEALKYVADCKENSRAADKTFSASQNRGVKGARINNNSDKEEKKKNEQKKTFF